MGEDYATEGSKMLGAQESVQGFAVGYDQKEHELELLISKFDNLQIDYDNLRICYDNLQMCYDEAIEENETLEKTLEERGAKSLDDLEHLDIFSSSDSLDEEKEVRLSHAFIQNVHLSL